NGFCRVLARTSNSASMSVIRVSRNSRSIILQPVQSNVSLTPAQTAKGALGETAFSFVQSSGLNRYDPFGLKVLVVRKPAVAYCRFNTFAQRANMSKCDETW